MNHSFGGKPLLGLATLLLILSTGAMTQAQAPRFSLGILGQYTPDGMLIQTVAPGSAADAAGLQRGDLIRKIDNQLIQNQDQLLTVLNTSGGSVLLIVRKAATGRTVRQALDLTGQRGGILAPYMLGIGGVYTPQGMRIQTVVPHTSAARIGLERGDLVLRINNQFIANQADFFTVLNTSGGSITLLVRKASGQTVRLDADLTTYELGAIGDFTPAGLRVAVVAPGTPAEWVGLQPGDLIGRIDNQFVRNQREFHETLRNSGGSVALQVRKGLTGQVGVLVVDLMNNPLGAWCEPGPEGMRITAVGLGTPAALLGLQRGDTIVKIDDQRVRTRRELLIALKNSGGLVTLIVRQAQTGRLARIDADLTR